MEWSSPFCAVLSQLISLSIWLKFPATLCLPLTLVQLPDKWPSSSAEASSGRESLTLRPVRAKGESQSIGPALRDPLGEVSPLSERGGAADGADR